MSLVYNGVNVNAVIYNGQPTIGVYNGAVIWGGEPPQPSLPPYTLRLKFNAGVTPTFSKGTGTLVDATNNIWDLTYENSSWVELLRGQSDLLEVVDGNTTGVVGMENMLYGCTSLTTVPLFDTSDCSSMLCTFYKCSSLTSVPLFNTSNVKFMNGMFTQCFSLTSIPLFDTSKVTNMYTMCSGCTNVQYGALALYQQASTQTTPPVNHGKAFTNCGRDTQTGAAELAQIPSDWK